MSDLEPSMQVSPTDLVFDAPTNASSSDWRYSRNYIIQTAATTIVMEIAVYGLVIAVLPNLLGELGAHDQQQARLTSYVLAIYTGTAALSSPFAGILADLSATRKLPLGAGLSIYLGATVAFFTAPNIVTALLAKFVQGSSSALMVAAAFAMCMDIVKLTEIGATLGLLLSVADAGALLSSPLGGFIYVHGGKLWLTYTSVTMLILALLMVSLVGEGEHKTHITSAAQISPCKPAPPASEESQPLLTTMQHPGDASIEDGVYFVQASSSIWTRKVPIVHCLKDYRFVGAIALCFVQSSLAGAFEAILPLEGERLFGLSPEEAGCLFIPLGVARYAFGVVGGWAVDRYGPRRLGLVFYLLQTPVLLMFYLLQSTPRIPRIVLMCCLLALTGMCMAAVGTVSFVESSKILDKYHRSNPQLFGKRSPFAGLTGITIMVWALGTSMGNLIAGSMRLLVGFGNTMAIFAGLSLLGVIGSYICLDEAQSVRNAESSALPQVEQSPLSSAWT